MCVCLVCTYVLWFGMCGCTCVCVSVHVEVRGRHLTFSTVSTSNRAGFPHLNLSTEVGLVQAIILVWVDF